MANIKLIKLKEDIAIEIDLHPDKYKDAGKWLDDFCSKFKQNTLPQTCLSKALHYWLNKYDGYESVKAEDGRCILFISFLLLEPDCDKIAGILSIFALKPWITEDDIDSRAWAGIPLQIGEYADKWEQLIKSSLKQVKLIDKLDAKIEKESWLWKLYEKTLKVIIDVIFEK